MATHGLLFLKGTRAYDSMPFVIVRSRGRFAARHRGCGMPAAFYPLLRAGYDAFYVALSSRVDAPFVTADEKLVRALAGKPFGVQPLSVFRIPPSP